MPHTPGPWERDKYRRDLVGGKGTYVAQVLNHFNPNRADSAGIFEANAKLIAAAPELLETLDNVSAALETCLAWFGDQMTPDDKRQRNQINAAARSLVMSLRVEHFTEE